MPFCCGIVCNYYEVTLDRADQTFRFGSTSAKNPVIMTRKKLIENEDKISLPSSSEDELLFAGNSSDDDISSEDDSKGESSDSDGAPEMVSFKSALENSKLLRKHTAEVIKTQKEERKRKRKEIQAKNLLQKEEKKQAIQQKKLPDDVLENLEDHSVLKPKDLSFENEPDNFEENYEESGLEKSTENPGDEDTVAVHGPTVFKCKILSKESKKPKRVFEEAMSFKERTLFDGRIRREKSSREAMLKISKQIAGGRRKAC
ncbi:uncharacterized protein LOC118197681 isoform X2 [Stegodyphus dumicola]|uniref:uncharacterized protein LOC118197681 isoform X2 n=1 Tax=Stegodyphus dumicola TaxID=202533 RepID=UPI0015AE6686|nr:uncharacterized protein LOC118197681 isoform X2 [Stegodyphus dumicola]